VTTPRPGDTVTVRVLRTSARAAGVEILCVEGGGDGPASTTTTTTTTTPLPDPGPPGVIRAADVRSTAVDSVDVGACFRPGDLVRATVSSVGDARAFYLSTAAPGLGVVSARSASHPARPRLEPASEAGMRCPLTGTVEPRKVAVKP
jgi:exosome complex component CSL4